MATAKYFEAWRRYPGDFSMIVLDRFVAKPSKLAFDPANGILMHMGFTEDRRYFSRDKTTEFALRDGNMGTCFLWKSASLDASFHCYSIFCAWEFSDKLHCLGH